MNNISLRLLVHKRAATRFFSHAVPSMCSFALRIIGSRFNLPPKIRDESLALQALRRRLQQLGHSQYLSRWPLASPAPGTDGPVIHD